MTAEWVTFIDPDDTIADDYFDSVGLAVRAHGKTEMVICHLMDHFEATGTIKDSHPLKYRFRGGDQLVDIDRFPEYVQMSASTSFFRMSRVAELVLRFDERIRPVFEDAHFVQKYLLALSTRLVSVVDSARYFYRRREDKSSSLQNSATDPGKYTVVLEYGCLDLLEQAAPFVPLWLQYAVLYKLTWTLRAEEAISSKTSGVNSAVATRFHELVSKIRTYLSLEAIEAFPLIKRSTSQWEALAYGYDGEGWRWSSAVVNHFDEARRLVELRYHFTGSMPHEDIRFRGKRAAPFASKTRSFNYLQRTLLHERIIWVSVDGTLEIRLDGQSVPLTFEWPKPKQFSVRPAAVQSLRGSRIPLPKQKKRMKTATGSDRAVSALARAEPIRRLFAGAWVLMDRDVNSNDNAEHLFRYLRKRRRDINAWFVVEKDSPDWKRLRAEGFKRLIPYGTTLWRALCLNARFLVSSHADRYVSNPFVLSNGEKPRWRFVFLQHGVTKDDISRWLNSKDIVGMVASTVDEYASIAGDNSPYILSSKEVALTGMPRYDVLAKKAAACGAGRRRSITFMPTWRQFLAGKAVGQSNRRDLNPEFFESEFLYRWLEFLQSDELKGMAQKHGCTITFMPHPNLEGYLSEITLPEHVEVVTYADVNVQDVIARSAVVVTDYSSIAFDAAVVHRPVVYYQFDRDRVFGGGHLTRPGYFSYENDGFGPVAEELGGVLDVLRATLEGGLDPAPEYRKRIERTFIKPGRACSAVTEMIESLDRPVAVGDHRPTPQAPQIQYLN